MKLVDMSPPSFSDNRSPLTVNASSDLLFKMLCPLGLVASLSHELSPEKVQDFLKSEKWTERIAALHIHVTSISGEQVLDALHDENEQVRAAAAKVLEKANSLEVALSVLSSLADSSCLVRAMAAQTVGRLRYRIAIAPLIELLDNDDDESVRAAAAQALGRMNEAFPLLLCCWLHVTPHG